MLEPRDPVSLDWPNWQLYYLYGLERACELNQVALLGDRDWYFVSVPVHWADHHRGDGDLSSVPAL